MSSKPVEQKRKQNIGQSIPESTKNGAKKMDEEKKFQILAAVLLGVSFAFLVVFLSKKSIFLLNSDESSELVLAKLLAAENGLLSKNWYYSNELRVLNTQIIYSFFFRLTSNWHLVRILSCSCMYLLFLLGYYYLCKKMHCESYFLLSAVLLILPFSTVYFEIVLKGAYYIPHILITFLTIGLTESYLEVEGKRKKRFWAGCNIVLAFLAGLGGQRQLLVLYIPMFLAGLWIVCRQMQAEYQNVGIVSIKGLLHKTEVSARSFLWITFLLCIGSGVGFVFQVAVLRNFYHFRIWGRIAYSSFDFSRLSQLFNGFLESYGFTTGAIYSGATLQNLACAGWCILTVLAVVTGLRKEKENNGYYRLSVFAVMAFVVFLLWYLFTDMDYVTRYNLPVIILSVPLIAVYIKQINLKKRAKNLLLLFFILLVAVKSIFVYTSFYNSDVTHEYRQIVSVLEQEEYEAGYATFWNANVLTELSNGAIEMWIWEADADGIFLNEGTDIDEIFQWLQVTSHETGHPAGKMFLLFSLTEFENNIWKDVLDETHIIYQSDNYVILGYDSYEAVRTDLEETE